MSEFYIRPPSVWTRMSLIEKLMVMAIVAIVIVVALGSLGTIDANGEIDPSRLCLFRGGVPITDQAGHLIRCDFPVNIGRIQ